MTGKETVEPVLLMSIGGGNTGVVRPFSAVQNFRICKQRAVIPAGMISRQE